VKRDRQVFELLRLDVVFDEAAQARVGDEVGAGSDEAEGRTPRQVAASASAVPTVCGRVAMKAPLMAPADVATIRSGAMPRSYRASSMPTWIAPSPAPPERTKATGDVLRAIGYSASPGANVIRAQCAGLPSSTSKSIRISSCSAIGRSSSRTASAAWWISATARS
jgi:hypothetical protein